MKTSTFRKLLVLVTCLFTGLTSQAQLTTTLEAYPAAEWGNEKPVQFKLTEVAQALQTDTTTLVTALNSWTAEGSTDANMFFLNTTEGLSDNYTQGGKGGFWVNADGIPQAWSGDNSALRWFNMIGWSTAENEDGAFTITMGQYPGQTQAGDVFKPLFVLKLGEKQVTMEVTFNIVEKPVVDIPDPELAYAKLDLVAQLTKDVNQKPRLDYTSDKVELDINEALTTLGLNNPALVKDELKQLLYVHTFYQNDDSEMVLSDSLSNQATANGIGFWLRALNDQEEGQPIQCASASYNVSDFYMEGFAFDDETGILSCSLGQQPNKLKGGETYFAYVYIIYGEKAIRVRYNLILEEVQTGGLADYEKAGEASKDIEMEPMGDYNTKDFSIDIEAIYTALGCEASDIDDFYMLDSDEAFAAKNEGGGGYWLNMDGEITPWGDNAMFYITPKAADFSAFGIGQYPNHMQVGDEGHADLYFLANGKYFKYTVNLKIVEPKVIEGEFESVAQRLVEVQQEVNNDYTWSNSVTFSSDWVAEQIGTSDWVVYGLAPLNEDGSEKSGNERYTKQYNCDPNPGFWLDANGRSNGWNSNARFGVSTAMPSGAITLIQYPGVTQIGDVFKTQLFFVNEETGKMVTFNINYYIVESVEEIEEVAKEDLTLPLITDAQITLDMNKVAEALETTLDELAQGKVLRALTADGTYSGATEFFDGLAFDIKGNCVLDEAAWYFDMEMKDDGSGQAVLTMTCIENLADDFSVSTVMCIQVGSKRYIYNVKFVSEAIWTEGIQTVSSDNRTANRIYDLQGREVQKAQRGLYIQNGRKFVVK